MLWDTTTQAWLAAGNAPNFHLALIISPVNLTTGQTETLCYWTGMETAWFNLDELRPLLPTRGALDIANPVYSVGTTVRTQTVSMFGLSDQAQDILQAYDVRFKPASTWQMCFSQGAEFIGVRKMFDGFVDSSPQVIKGKGQGASLEISIASALRLGTRTRAAKKSDASYMARGGDTSMEYASLTQVDGDYWGPQG